MEQTILETIKKRRSIYPEFFNGDPIQQWELERLLEVASYAPNHKMTEPWRFTVITGASKDAFQAATKEYMLANENFAPKADRLAHRIQLSQAILVIKFQRDPMQRLPEWEELAATAMAVQNIWLYAGELGMGGYWSSGRPLMESVSQFIELAPGEEVKGLFFLGKHDMELKDRPRKSIEEFTTWLK